MKKTLASFPPTLRTDTGGLVDDTALCERFATVHDPVSHAGDIIDLPFLEDLPQYRSRLQFLP